MTVSRHIFRLCNSRANTKFRKEGPPTIFLHICICGQNCWQKSHLAFSSLLLLLDEVYESTHIYCVTLITQFLDLKCYVTNDSTHVILNNVACTKLRIPYTNPIIISIMIWVQYQDSIPNKLNFVIYDTDIYCFIFIINVVNCLITQNGIHYTFAT